MKRNQKNRTTKKIVKVRRGDSIVTNASSVMKFKHRATVEIEALATTQIATVKRKPRSSIDETKDALK